MNISLDEHHLTNSERAEIKSLLERAPIGQSELEQMWYLMDLVWDDYNCDNQKLNWNQISEFYSHPVWLLNGLFIEQDNVSMQHRYVISDWVIKNRVKRVVDYGGGFGTLARLIAEKDSKTIVDIYEPHPSRFGLKRASEFSNINMIDKLTSGYDAMLSTDVLEHVPDPLVDFSFMINSVNVGGHLIIANCFFPVIKCHLPQNFHFRFTFNIFARMMGLEVCGVLDGSHATLFKKTKEKQLNWKLIRATEFISKCLFSIVQPLISLLRPIKRLFSN